MAEMQDYAEDRALIDESRFMHIHVNGLDVRVPLGPDGRPEDLMGCVKNTLGGGHRHEWLLRLRDEQDNLVDPSAVEAGKMYNCDIPTLDEKIQHCIGLGGEYSGKLLQIQNQLAEWKRGEVEACRREPPDYEWAKHCRDYAGRRLRAKAAAVIQQMHVSEEADEADEGRIITGVEHGSKSIRAWIVCCVATLCVALILLSVLAWHYSFLDRNDRYSPSGVALSERHFSHNNMAFLDHRCLAGAAPTASPTSAPSTSPPSAAPSTPTVPPTGPPTVSPSGSPTHGPTPAGGTLVPTGSPTGPPTGSPTVSPTLSPSVAAPPGCTFHVPTHAAFAVCATAFFAALASAFFFFFLVDKSQGDERMQKITSDKKAIGLRGLLRAASWAARFAAGIALFLWIAIDGVEATRDWRPDVFGSFLAGTLAGMLCATVSHYAVCQGAGRAAAACWMKGIEEGAGSAQHCLWRAALAGGLGVAALSALAPAVLYGAFGNVQVVAASAFGGSVAALVTRVAGGMLTAAANMAAEESVQDLHFTPKQHMNLVFSRFDHDGDGVLSEADLCALARGTKKTPEQRQSLIEAAIREQGGLDCEQLLEWYRKNGCDLQKDWCDLQALDHAGLPLPNHPTALGGWVGPHSAGIGVDICETFATGLGAAVYLGAPEFGERGVALPLYLSALGVAVGVFVCAKLCCVPPDDQGDGDSGGTHNTIYGPRALPYRLAVGLAALVGMALSVLLCVGVLWDERDLLNDVPPEREHYPGLRCGFCVVIGTAAAITCAICVEQVAYGWERNSVARATRRGAGEAVSHGYAFGMALAALPALAVAAAVLGATHLAGMYGVALAAVGSLMPLSAVAILGVAGAACEHMGVMVELARLPEWVRARCQNLRSVGVSCSRHSHAISACAAVLSTAAVAGAFSRAAGITSFSLFDSETLGGVLAGAFIVVAAGASATLGANSAARAAVTDARHQWMGRLGTASSDDQTGALDDVAHTVGLQSCISEASQEAIKHAAPLSALATLAPLALGLTFGARAVAGVLYGAVAVGLLLCVQWAGVAAVLRGARRWIERGQFTVEVRPRSFSGELVESPEEAAWGGPRGGLGGSHGAETVKKNTRYHNAIIVGEHLASPLQDAGSPAVSSVIKHMANVSLVCNPLFDDAFSYWYVGLITMAAATMIVLIVRHFAKRQEDW
eukprot:TRINITY_DN12813_c0_g1_i1.p1 TRINITY_DN12813_c0_g1~~TRINITY_DN12813_c0_g1_i1.p1  ORF type:complete len:1183 (+),score=317.58 TRINITY_DN12813_c0_g1_i1:114-3662(+)